MTYFYKVHGTIARKIGGEPPADDYVAMDSNGRLKHILHGEVIEENYVIYPTDATTSELKELYKNEMGKALARDMLFPKFRKKKSSKPKPLRKVKVDKKCKCK